jgi:hypothetical protein
VKPLRLAFASLLLICACSPCIAAVLVRSCDTAGASCAKWTWVLPANAKAVQVNRGAAAPFALLADVLPTERIASCYDDPGVTIGSATVCAARVPGRTDVWQLKSALYPVATPTKSIGLVIDASNPHWDSGAPVASNVLADLSVRLYGAPEGQQLALLDSTPWSGAPRFRRESMAGERWCFAAALALDTTGDGTADKESAPTASSCGTFADPAPVIHLAPPNSLTLYAPAP